MLAVAATLLITGACTRTASPTPPTASARGASRERKLEIMRDSQIGTYGASALVLSLMLRAGAIASLAEPALAALGADRRACRRARDAAGLHAARAERRGKTDSRPMPASRRRKARSSPSCSAWSCSCLCLGFGATLIAVAAARSAVGLMAWLCIRQIGGQTGDVLGAVEQVSEILILLVAAAWL